MKSSEEVLSSILKTTQMGQIGIRSVLRQPLNTELKQALVSQRQEYDSIETEAHRIANAYGYTPKELNPAVRKMTDSMTSMRLMYGDIDSKSAAMMIQGNTRGMIKGLKNRHHAKNPDTGILSLSQKLLDTEEANIRQMQGYV